MARTLAEKDTANVLGLTVKTLARYREVRPNRQPVPFDLVNGRYFYDPAEVKGWMDAHGLDGRGRPGLPIAPAVGAPAAVGVGGPTMGPPPVVAAAPAPPPIAQAAPAQAASTPPVSAYIPPPDPGALADARNRQNMRTAELAQKAMKAEKQKRDLDIEKGLADLGLDRKIREAVTLADVSALATEVAALTAAGKVSHSTGRVLRELLTEKRQNIKAEAKERRETAEATVDRAILCQQGETAELVRLYEGIIKDDRRARVMRYIAAVADEDAQDSPQADTGEPAQDSGA